MTPYWAVASACFRVLLQYRAAAAAGFGTQLFWGLIRVMVFDAFYRSSGAPQPMSYPQVVTYVWISQALFALLPLGPDADVRAMVRTGTVAYELLRPLDLYALWYSRALAQRTATAGMRAVPMFLVAGCFLGLQPPPTWTCAAAWAVTTAGAVLLVCAVSTLATISVLWTISGEGISRMLPILAFLFSGIMLPIPLFPDWAQPLLNFLPFRGILDTPLRLYIGHLPPGQVFGLLAHQLAWTAAFVALGRWVLARGARRLTVQGG
ncbi:MAG: ABC-2 family transporter protein [Armatimonadetes bacterium]|nr:ABC-2 family transporter protein [Armatimonadota bacterium]